MNSAMIPLLFSCLLGLVSLVLAAPGYPKEVAAPLALPTPIHLHSYTNPSTSSDCNLDCRRIFCNSVSQFLESVTCTQHRPCLSLNLQFKIQEKCLNWRPEIHHGAGVATVDGVAIPASTKADVVASSNDSMEPDCMDGTTPQSAPQWVKAYVPTSTGYEWLRKGEATHAHLMPALGDEMDKTQVNVCMSALRWAFFVAVAVALFCAWKVKERKVMIDRRVKGKEDSLGH